MSGITARRLEKMKRVLAWRQKDLTLVLANIHDPHNVSAIYRSCDAFGVAGVHLYYTDTAFPALGLKSSASARKWVRTYRHKDVSALREALAGFQILVTSFSSEAIALGEHDLARPTAIIMGNEHSGVPEELRNIVCNELFIPMYGMIESFNVSVAAAIILAEASRQRVLAGKYDHSAYTVEEYEQCLREWMEK
jgi:tRNA (guanosine-2'-O-)-methyltransferase